MKEPTKFEFNHSGTEVLENWLNQLAGEQIENTIVTKEFQLELYKRKAEMLDRLTNEYVARKEALEAEVTKEIQEILLTKGIEILELTRKIETDSQELGACTARIWLLEGNDK